jgi:hypothetical protein
MMLFELDLVKWFEYLFEMYDKKKKQQKRKTKNENLRKKR